MKRNPALLASVLCALSMPSAAQKISVQGSFDSCNVRIEGAITSRLPSQLAAILKASCQPGDSENTRGMVVIESSPGGDLRAAIEAGRILRRQRVSVIAIGECASACVFLYVGGILRVTGTRARFGFHQAYFIDPSSSGAEARARQAQSRELAKGYLQEMGIPDQFLLVMDSRTPDDVLWLSTEVPDQEQRLRELQIVGTDRAFKDAADSARARQLGISLADYYARLPLIEKQCMSVLNDSLPSGAPRECNQRWGKWYFACEENVLTRQPVPPLPAATGGPDYPGDFRSASAILRTTQGEVRIRLLPDVAPGHVRRFLGLVASGHYDGTAFHRVIPGFMIQGGDPQTRDEAKRPLWGIGANADECGQPIRLKAEFSDIHHKRGIVSMARSSDPDSASSQFFIVVADAPFLDGQYTAFGEIAEGMDVVDRLVSASNSDTSDPRTGGSPRKLQRILRAAVAGSSATPR